MKPTLQQSLAAMPARQLNLIAVGIVAIAVALVWTLAIRAPLAALRLQQAQLASLAASRAAAMPATPTAAAALPPAQEAPEPPAPLALIAALGASARTAGLSVGGAVPGAERSVAGLHQQTLDIEASGNYGAILAWLDEIEATQPAVGVTRLVLHAAPDEPGRLVQLQLGAYATESKAEGKR
jgi:type II secretory pathway component PulM